MFENNFNRIFFYFSVSKGYSRVDSRIDNFMKIIGQIIGNSLVDKKVSQIQDMIALKVKILGRANPFPGLCLSVSLSCWTIYIA